MKVIMQSVFASALLLISSLTWAQVEIGIGANASNEAVTALFRVDAQYEIAGGEYAPSTHFIVARIKANGSIESGDFNYIDVEVTGPGVAGRWGNELVQGYIEGNLVNYKFKRDIALDMGHHLSINLIGLGGGFSVTPVKNLKLFLNVAVDFLTLSMASQRASDGMAMYRQGKESGSNGAFELGVVIADKIRIAFGQRSHDFRTNGYEYDTGRESCSEDGYWEEDIWGDSYWVSEGTVSCYPVMETNYQEYWQHKETYVEIKAQLTKRLSVFSRASYSIYRVADETGSFQGSENASWKFLFGVSYIIGSNR